MAKATNAEEYFEVIKRFAPSRGLIVNPDEELARTIVEGLWRNKQKFGYPSCSCCFANGDPVADADIICPCDDSVQALAENGICRCGLYVTQDYVDRNPREPHEKSCPREPR